MKFLGPVASIKQALARHEKVHAQQWPKRFLAPVKPTDVVQVLMTEEMARTFERRCLGLNTRGRTKLSVPLLFREDDLPTYSIDICDNHPMPDRGVVEKF